MTRSGTSYGRLDEFLARTIAGPAGFHELVQKAPVPLQPAAWFHRVRRREVIAEFLRTTLAVFREVMQGQGSPELQALLWNDVPPHYRQEFHAGLPDAVWRIPAFYRTDEAADGTIFEIQCPGSGWGDLPLLSEYYEVPLTRYDAARTIAEDIVSYCGRPEPHVLHLLDNASNPVSMRYLMARTQPPLRYWGYHPAVRVTECDFIRSHSFYGLTAENLFRIRLKHAAENKVRFDLPPLVVFDQKAPLCLPFLRETRDRYSAAVREALAYSAPVTPEGFQDVDGAWVTIEEFLARKPAGRRYFLKYAGCDVTLNWGTRGVYRLNDRMARMLIERAVSDARLNHPWLIQPEISEKHSMQVEPRGETNPECVDWTAKYSSFYSPYRLTGIRTMHRHHYKVHGQQDTALGIMLPPEAFHESKLTPAA